MSSRYARLTLAVLLVALVPTVVNSYLGTPVDDGPTLEETVPASLDGFRSEPTKRRDASAVRTFAASDWIERRYSKAGQPEVTVLVVRSFDMKKLYHHPELAVASGIEYRPARVERFESASGVIDVHVLEGQRTGLVAYALLYGDETIARPLVFQLRVAPELLVRGRRPLTLVLVSDPRHGADATALVETPALTLLKATVEALRGADGVQ